MNKLILFILFIAANVFSEVTENIRKEYGLKFHNAFVLQCQGKSTQAFFSFSEGALSKSSNLIANFYC
jgi:hypothetical protein